jgi:dynein heavy chain, axonemal
MPEEGELFGQVDLIYKKYMEVVVQEPSVMITAPQPDLLEDMTKANIMMEKISAGVNDYLEKKRLFFPRFFFLSNDEMLEILSETKDPLRVQPHLNKCFEGIYRLNFNDLLEAVSMISVEKEEVEFLRKVSTAEAKGSVEKWLSQVEHQMLASIKKETLNSLDDYAETKRTEWITKWPGMVVLAVSQIYWAADIESKIQEQKLSDYFDYLQNQLIDTVGMVRSQTITNLDRITIKALIVIDVHAKDVVEHLVKSEVVDVNDFQWLRQLRYYMENKAVDVRIINACVPYAYEYLGNSDRLVITPLTDRCYITLMSAYQLHLNGAPEGKKLVTEKDQKILDF